MAADILLHGRGDAHRDLEVGMGWLGAAARPQTAPAIQTCFRQAMAKISAHRREHIEDTVRRYRERWSTRGWRASCRRMVPDSPAGMGVTSQRLNKRMRCTFMDEIPVCRSVDFDLGRKPSIRPLEWICDPLTG